MRWLAAAEREERVVISQMRKVRGKREKEKKKKRKQTVRQEREGRKGGPKGNAPLAVRSRLIYLTGLSPSTKEVF
ncbi:hypothetical protein M408DRAFT_332421 [Serendipita vermifera MAFF 305830]|uniref:Uncharacterized protein n=1 Tax=Serendipita vermifera MAFF 305830 TaxID=933852 RepID=A0A0C2WA73_SERVB|nr:hypothetical protein M408DRAFT_332421 [Serendipita vermifera MAFF 305830]